MSFWDFGASDLLSAGTSLLGGFLGGGKKSGNSKWDAVIAAQSEKERLENIAGGSGAKSSTEPLESMGDTVARNIGQYGNQMASEFTQKLSSRFIDSKVNNMFSGQSKSERLMQNPSVRGAMDRQYTQARYPGTNVYEQMGGGGGGQPSQGGTTAPQIARKSARDSAQISSTPSIKRLNIEYQDLPHRIREVKSRTAKNVEDTKFVRGPKTAQVGAQTAETKEHTKWIPTLNNIRANLERAKTFLAGTQDVQAQSNIKNIEANTKHKLQTLVTEIQRSGIAKHDETIRKNLARVSNILTGTDARAYVTLGIGAVGALLKSLPLGAIAGAVGMGKKGRGGAPKTPSQWRQWRMDTGKLNKATGALYD